MEKLCTQCGELPKAKCHHSWCGKCHNAANVERRNRLVADGFCVVCGTAPHKRGQRMCEVCTDVINVRMKEARKLWKIRAVEYLGGACVDCGLHTDVVDVYDFHHLNPADKVSGVAKLTSWKKVFEEISKCVLLCANCHRFREARQRDS